MTREQAAAECHPGELAKRTRRLDQILAANRAVGLTPAGVDIRAGTHWLRMVEPGGDLIGCLPITPEEAARMA